MKRGNRVVLEQAIGRKPDHRFFGGEGSKNSNLPDPGYIQHKVIKK